MFRIALKSNTKEIPFPEDEVVGRPPVNTVVNPNNLRSENITYEKSYNDSIGRPKDLKLNLSINTILDDKIWEKSIDTTNTNNCEAPEIIKPKNELVNFKIDTISVTDFKESQLTVPSMGSKNYFNFQSFTEDHPWFTGYNSIMKTDELMIYMFGPSLTILENKKYYQASPSIFGLENGRYFFVDFEKHNKNVWIAICNKNEDSLLVFNYNGTNSIKKYP